MVTRSLPKPQSLGLSTSVAQASISGGRVRRQPTVTRWVLCCPVPPSFPLSSNTSSPPYSMTDDVRGIDHRCSPFPPVTFSGLRAPTSPLFANAYSNKIFGSFAQSESECGGPTGFRIWIQCPGMRVFPLPTLSFLAVSSPQLPWRYEYYGQSHSHAQVDRS